MDHFGYLAFAIGTHAAVGYAVVRLLTSGPPVLGVLAGVGPDLDLLFGPSLAFPFVHRGLFHTPLLLAVVLGLLFVADSPRWLVVGVAGAFLSHLIIDTFTNAGIMWLYPLSTQFFSADIAIHSTPGNLVLWGMALVMVRWGGRNRFRQATDRMRQSWGSTRQFDR